MDEFVIKLKSGDTQSFEELVNMYQGKIFSMAIGFLSNREDALDVTQEVFLKVYRSIGSFKGDSSLSTWIYSVARNMCIDFLRKNKKVIVEELPETIPDDGSTNPAHIYELLEKKELVREALDKLPPNYRVILLMREYRGLSYSEIAEALDISEGTVKSRISRAREHLIKIIKEKKELFLN